MRLRSAHCAFIICVVGALVASAGTLSAQVLSAPGTPRVYAGTPTAPAVTITVLPSNAAVQTGAQVRFSAQVDGTSNTSVSWTATGGTIDGTGLYTAGSVAGTYNVTARLTGGTIAKSVAVTVQSGAGYIDILPGEDIQTRINAMPTGTAFRLRAGVHRLTAPLTPRDNMTFIGEPGAVVTGARPLTGFTRSGSYWVIGGQTQQSSAHGECQSAYPRCNLAEDLYVDDVMLQHVSSLSQVGPGKWFFNYDTDQIYIYDDPTGRRVETTYATEAFGGAASSVTITGLTIEKFRNPAQRGAIHGERTTNWLVQDNVVRFNHGVGIWIGPAMRVLRNQVYRNGQLGIGGRGDGILVEKNEIASNNSAHYDAGWEGGGTKFAITRNLMVRGNFVHHNDGPGLWTDINNIYTTYEDNIVEDNLGMGIFHEISYDAVIRRNTVRRNGLNFTTWLWGAGILVAASPNVQIYENLVEDNGNGITALQQNRGSGTYGPWVVTNLDVHNNTVRMTKGMTGVATDTGDTAIFTSRNNRFTNNTYYLGTNPTPFAWNNQPMNETSWKSYGQDTGGVFSR